MIAPPIIFAAAYFSGWFLSSVDCEPGRIDRRLLAIRCAEVEACEVGLVLPPLVTLAEPPERGFADDGAELYAWLDVSVLCAGAGRYGVAWCVREQIGAGECAEVPELAGDWPAGLISRFGWESGNFAGASRVAGGAVVYDRPLSYYGTAIGPLLDFEDGGREAFRAGRVAYPIRDPDVITID